jgi:hypothetical protein
MNLPSGLETELPRPISEAEFLAERDTRFIKEDLELSEGIHVLPINTTVISHVLDMGRKAPEGDEYGIPRPFWVPETYKHLILTVFDDAVAPDDPVLLELSTEICAQYENMDFSIIREEEYSYFANVFGKTAPILIAKKLLLWEGKQPVPRLREYLGQHCVMRVLERYKTVSEAYAQQALQLTEDAFADFRADAHIRPRPGMDADIVENRLERLRITIKDPVRFVYDWLNSQDEPELPGAYYSATNHEATFTSKIYDASVHKHYVKHELAHAVSAASYGNIGGKNHAKRSGLKGFVKDSWGKKDEWKRGNPANEAHTEIAALYYDNLAPDSYDFVATYHAYREAHLGMMYAVGELAPTLLREFEALYETAYWQHPQTDTYCPERWPARKAANRLLDEVFAPGFRNLIDPLLRKHGDEQFVFESAFEKLAATIKERRSRGVELTAQGMANALGFFVEEALEGVIRIDLTDDLLPTIHDTVDEDGQKVRIVEIR